MTMYNGFLSNYERSHTAYQYKINLMQAETIIGKSLDNATSEDIVKYREWLSKVGRQNSTVYQKLSTLSSYFGFLKKIGKRTDNPMDAIRRPRVDYNRSMQWLTDDEVRALLDKAASGAKQLALVWLALHGLRVSEIIGLNVEQYMDGILWNVAGKGGMSRNIPLAVGAQNALTAYIGERRTGPLFLSRRGRKKRAMHVRTAQRMVYGLTQAIGHQVSIHALRHTYGTRAVRRGVNTLALAQLMGHKSLTTTEKYVHLDAEALRPYNEEVYPSESLRVISGGSDQSEKPVENEGKQYR